MISIELPWPHGDLSPNARPHFMQLARVKKAAREEAYWATKIVKPVTWAAPESGDIILRQVAHPPDKRDRDRDGIDARLKAARDGIADALGVNDRRFRPTGIEWGEPIKGGKIVIEVQA